MISATGDVFSVSDVLEYIEMGCVGVMIARGALKDPFIVTEALKALGYSVGMDDSPCPCFVAFYHVFLKMYPGLPIFVLH